MNTKSVQANYGKDEESCIKAVKKVYNELQLEDRFKAYEQESYDALKLAIQKQQELPPAVFALLLNKIYKRTK